MCGSSPSLVVRPLLQKDPDDHVRHRLRISANPIDFCVPQIVGVWSKDGTVLPPLPGPIVVFAGVLVAAWSNGFTRIGASTVVLLVLVTTAAHVVDLASAAARQAF